MKNIKLIPGDKLVGFALVGNVPEGACPECAVVHPPENPHDKGSLFYQYKFYNEFGVWPTWEDAMAHCPEEIKEVVKETLISLGIGLGKGVMCDA